MNCYALIPLVALVGYIPLLILATSGQPRQQRELFLWYLFASIVMSMSSFLLHSGFFEDKKLLLARLNICAFTWVAVQIYLFTRSYGHGPYILWRGFAYALLALVIILAIAEQIPRGIEFNEGIIVNLGLWVWVMLIPVLVLTIENLIALIRKLRYTSNSVNRKCIVMTLAGVGIITVTALPNAIEFLRKSPIDHLGNLTAASLWVYVITHSK